MLLAVVFSAGVLHGLAPDHLAAITALSAIGGSARRIVFFALRFAAGHALVIAAAGLAAHFGRGLLPAIWEQRLDIAAGAILMVAGTVLLAALATGRVRFHAHEHGHGGGEHRHFHVHLFSGDTHRHVHGSLAAGLGALFALGGARALLSAIPIAITHTLAESALRVAVFAGGIAVAMALYGLLAGRILRGTSGPTSPAALRFAALLTAVSCVVAGGMTIAGRLHG